MDAYFAAAPHAPLKQALFKRMKSKKLIILTALLILLAQNSQANQKESEEKVYFTTNKTEYIQGDIISLLIRNNLSSSIWYVDFPQPDLSVWNIEIFENNKWENFSYKEDGAFCLPVKENNEDACYINYYERPIGRIAELSSGDFLSLQWDQNICPYSLGSASQPFKPVLFKPGHYRFSLRYGKEIKRIPENKKQPWERDVELSNIETIFSNEFTIIAK